MAKNILNEVSKDEEARAYYESQLIFELDQRGKLNQALREGEEKGKIEVVKEMFYDDMDIEIISKYTKLSVDKIKEVLKS